MTHINLGLVFHQHQPVGNFDFVFDELYQKSYQPLLAALERHPGVRAGLHYSGPLLDWLRAHRPEYLDRVRALLVRGQVELLGGGYYEPILPALSDADRLGQMKKMRAAIARDFGADPAGMWLPERVWEPDLPRTIAAAGYQWTIVDDVHFQAAGVAAEALTGWYLTGDQGRRVGVYGSSTSLRYLVPWGAVEDCIDFLRSHGDRHPGGLVVMGDDGEKFGGWPTTYAHCWENGWVDAFFARLEAESHWIATVTLSEWQRSHRPAGLVYLPSASYMEMGEWSLPPAEQHALETAQATLRQAGRGDLVRFVRGGHWRNFLARYPEVALLQDRVALLSEAAHRTGHEQALDHLWQAQCNCAWWHGVFGGVYLEHIRHANFANVAKADALLHEVGPAQWADFDADAEDEVCMRSGDHTVIIDPPTGEILHWELPQQGWHLTHAVARRPEAYHRAVAEAAGADGPRNIHDATQVKDPAALAEIGRYDRGLRVAAQDWFVPEACSQAAYRDLRLAARPDFAVEAADDQRLLLADPSGLRKAIALGAELTVSYATAGRPLASEWNLSLPDAGGGLAIEHGEGVLTIAAGSLVLAARHNAQRTWHERILTASNTEGGIELSPQGWTFVFHFEGDGGFIAWSAQA
ncbi:MAG: alpha-amylase/4-alpha-glucanotransferase domain-containing protein [Dehalococcoidia bacterium]